jgi:TolB-like protein
LGRSHSAPNLSTGVVANPAELAERELDVRFVLAGAMADASDDEVRFVMDMAGKKNHEVLEDANRIMDSQGYSEQFRQTDIPAIRHFVAEMIVWSNCGRFEFDCIQAKTFARVELNDL